MLRIYECLNALILLEFKRMKETNRKEYKRNY